MTDKTQALHSVQSTVDNSNTAPHQHAATITASNSSTRPPQPRRSHDRQIPIIAPALPIVAHPHIQMHQIQLIAPLQHANHVFTASLVSSAIFRGRKKRSGKWTNEEEVYADMLIELFEKGLINEQNGCTLRSCLSRRLHCLPMRISKKYAGKGIGKAVYLSKNRVGSLDPSMLQRTMSRLRDAEMKFLKVVYPELNLEHAASQIGFSPLVPAPLVPLIPAPQPNGNQMLIQPHVGGVASVPSTFQRWSQNQQISPSCAPLQPYNIQQPLAPRTDQTGVGAQPHHVGNGNGSSSYPQAANSHVGPQQTTTSAQSLHQAYMKIVQNEPKQVSQAPAQLPHSQASRRVASNVGSQQAHSLQQAYLSATEGATGTYNESPTNANASAHGRSSMVPAKSEISSASSCPKGIEMPDFLSGFDQVAEMKNTASVLANTPADQISTFTSKSFDDFHRLLGKNLSPVSPKETTENFHVTQGAAPSFPVGQNTVSHPIKLAPQLQTHSGHSDHELAALHKAVRKGSDNFPDSNSLTKAFNEALSQATTNSIPTKSLGADFYNIFAQQSAIAASQHSAYTGGNEMEPFGLYESMLPTSSSHTRNVVSEPSTTSGSDHGTEETDESPGETSDAAGGSDNASNQEYSSNDSDGTSSESSRSRKKSRVSYEASSRRADSVSTHDYSWM